MNEDEAFIRAIVDNPGDDTHRLVYADWLDDRSDPRGAFLRAECRTVETGDIAALRELAIGLDPVWVARVSLPPVGICCEHFELAQRGPIVTDAEIKEVEEKLGVTLPADYRAFLLNYNGAAIGAGHYYETPDGDLLRTPQGEPVDSFQGHWRLNSLQEISHHLAQTDEFFRTHPTDPEAVAWLRRFVFVGNDPDVIWSIILGISAPNRGEVWMYDASGGIEGGYYSYLAGRKRHTQSFAEFLSYLPDYPPRRADQ
jgi:uncharacterized protein (TIGR02996 family)